MIYLGLPPLVLYSILAVARRFRFQVSGTVVKFGEPMDLTAVLVEELPSLSHGIRGKPLQVVVFGNVDDVIDLVAFAPGQHFLAAKSGVTAKGNLDLRPDFSETLHQQRQNGPRMFRPIQPIDLARTKVADQQLITAEHIQRQIAVVIVVAMEEPAFLIPM